MFIKGPEVFMITYCSHKFSIIHEKKDDNKLQFGSDRIVYLTEWKYIFSLNIKSLDSRFNGWKYFKLVSFKKWDMTSEFLFSPFFLKKETPIDMGLDVTEEEILAVMNFLPEREIYKVLNIESFVTRAAIHGSYTLGPENLLTCNRIYILQQFHEQVFPVPYFPLFTLWNGQAWKRF